MICMVPGNDWLVRMYPVVGWDNAIHGARQDALN